MPGSAVFIIGIPGGRRHKLRIALVGNRAQPYSGWILSVHAFGDFEDHSTQHVLLQHPRTGVPARVQSDVQLNSSEKAKLAFR
jgi:hypothetical protein